MPFIQSGGATSQLLEATGGVLYIPPSGALKHKCSKRAPPRNSPCSSLTNSVSEVAPRAGRIVCNGDLAILQQVQELECPMRYRLLPAVVRETAPMSGPQGWGFPSHLRGPTEDCCRGQGVCGFSLVCHWASGRCTSGVSEPGLGPSPLPACHAPRLPPHRREHEGHALRVGYCSLSVVFVSGRHLCH